MSYIYCFTVPKPSNKGFPCYKIGYTENLERRLNAHKTTLGYKPELNFCIKFENPGMISTEKNIHRHLDEYRVGEEFYEGPLELIEEKILWCLYEKDFSFYKDGKKVKVFASVIKEFSLENLVRDIVDFPFEKLVGNPKKFSLINSQYGNNYYKTIVQGNISFNEDNVILHTFTDKESQTFTVKDVSVSKIDKDKYQVDFITARLNKKDRSMSIEELTDIHCERTIFDDDVRMED